MEETYKGIVLYESCEGDGLRFYGLDEIDQFTMDDSRGVVDSPLTGEVDLPILRTMWFRKPVSEELAEERIYNRLIRD